MRTFSEDCNTMKKLTYLSASTAGKSYVTNKEVPELDNLLLRTKLFFPRNDKGKKKKPELELGRLKDRQEQAS